MEWHDAWAVIATKNKKRKHKFKLALKRDRPAFTLMNAVLYQNIIQGL